MKRVVLVSTYDLGRQPFGLASPAAWLSRRGDRVRCLDLAVEPLDEEAIRAADCVAFHLPMHTATRLATRMVERVRALNPAARLGFYGLYAAMNERRLRLLGAEFVLGGEFEEELVARIHREGPLSGIEERPGALGEPGGSASGPGAPVPRLSFITPDRGGLPPLSSYAHLHDGSGRIRRVGYTEATRGCKHQCRHCPVVPVYRGRFRVVPRDVVLADIRQQVEAGAEHITFGDPDFLNGVGHALPLVRSLHREHPDLTYDATIKIEHLLHHRQHLATLRETGCVLITSAVESIDDRVLGLLEKGHTRADFHEAVREMRAASITLNPTFVAFTPWISLDGYRELLASIAELDLVESVAPIQLAIRLLIPEGSRLLELAEVRALVEPFDDGLLVYPWKHRDPDVDRLQREAQTLIQEGLRRRENRRRIFARVWELAGRALGRDPGRIPTGRRVGRAPVPFLTEPWYC